MSLTTYGGLKTAVAAWSTRSDLTEQMDDFVLWAHQEIGRKLRSNALIASTTLTLTSPTISQPTRFLALRRAYLDTSPIRALDVASPETLAEITGQTASVTYPTHIGVEGANLRFAPDFTGTTTTAHVLYYEGPVLMVDDADANTVLVAYPYLYLWGALAALFSYLEDDNNADRYEAKFEALIEDINRRDAASVMSGPLQSRHFGGGVV